MGLLVIQQKTMSQPDRAAEGQTRQPAQLDVAPKQGVQASILALQHSVGNHAVTNLLHATEPAHDDHEEEADRLADEILQEPHDLASVRIHRDADSELAADVLDAEAFTIGSDIHLGRDAPALSSPEGRRLIGHELVHVRQQSVGAAPRGVVQTKRRKPKAKRGKAESFRIAVDHAMGPDELLRTFVAQYYRITDPLELNRVVARWHWTPNPRYARDKDVARGFVQVNVYDTARTEFEALAQKDKEAVNTETDRRFFAETGLDPKTKLSAGPEDEELAARWRGIRANLLAEQEQARALIALPDDIKKILFAGGRQIKPEEYERALLLADRLGRLSKAERAQYLARVNSSTDDLDDLSKAIEGFERTQRMRAFDEEQIDAAAADIFGLEELYDLYKAKKAADQLAAIAPYVQATAILATPGTMGGTVGYAEAQEAADKKFRAALARSKFRTIEAFEAALTTYRQRFRTAAVNLALDVLASYDHLLYVAKLKFRDTDAANQLVTAIAGSGAAAGFQAAEDKEAKASLAEMRVADDLPRMSMRLYPGDPFQLRAEGKALRASAEEAVVEASGHEPLVDPKVMGRGTSREKLAGLSGPEARDYLLEVIEDRLHDTARARAEFYQDPDRVFSQSDLILATMESQGIEEKTIYGRIIQDHLADIRSAHIFSAIVLGIIAIVLAVLVPGGGWLAAAALVANATISSVQAFQAIDDYRKQSRDYRLNFISNEPSLLWVGIAVAAAALDLGLTAAQLLKASAKGLSELEVPLREFAAATDVETAASRLEQLTARIDAATGLEQELKTALKARAAAELGFNRALGKTMSLKAGVDPTPLFEALYYGVKKGSNTITKLRKEAQLMEVLGDITKLPAGSLDELTVAFRRVKKVIAIAERRGMDEATALKYVDRLAAERAGGEGAFEVLTTEMGAWKPMTPQQLRADATLATAHTELLDRRRMLQELEAELEARPRHADGTPDADRMREIEDDLRWLKGETKQTRTGRHRVPGALEEAQKAFADAMRLAEQARLDPKILMRRAFAASTERGTVLDAAKGVDQVGGLLTPASGIHPDHIVSLQRMTQLEGFEKLTLAERNQLAILEKNLVAMDAAANLSKGERSWSLWKQASFFYPGETITRMAQREAGLLTEIQDWIKGVVAGRP